jgi:hypothetical protein
MVSMWMKKKELLMSNYFAIDTSFGLCWIMDESTATHSEKISLLLPVLGLGSLD